MTRLVEVAWASKMPLVTAAQIGVVHIVDFDAEPNASRKRLIQLFPRPGDVTLCGRSVGRHSFTSLPDYKRRCRRCGELSRA